MLVEVGKFYNAEVKDLRAASLKVNDDGSSILRPVRSYWDTCIITLKCEFIADGCVIFREFNTSKIVYGVDDLNNTTTFYDLINEENYNTFKKNILGEDVLWISKNNLHEITKKDIVTNNIEASKSVDHLIKTSKDDLLRGFEDMCNISYEKGHVKIKQLQKR